jgi:hypothetical protein
VDRARGYEYDSMSGWVMGGGELARWIGLLWYTRKKRKM